MHKKIWKHEWIPVAKSKCETSHIYMKSGQEILSDSDRGGDGDKGEMKSEGKRGR
jgi:hypothetical protein